MNAPVRTVNIPHSIDSHIMNAVIVLIIVWVHICFILYRYTFAYLGVGVVYAGAHVFHL